VEHTVALKNKSTRLQTGVMVYLHIRHIVGPITQMSYWLSSLQYVTKIQVCRKPK